MEKTKNKVPLFLTIVLVIAIVFNIETFGKPILFVFSGPANLFRMRLNEALFCLVLSFPILLFSCFLWLGKQWSYICLAIICVVNGMIMFLYGALGASELILLAGYHFFVLLVLIYYMVFPPQYDYD